MLRFVKGKLPRETIEVTYDLEYGSDTLTLHKDAITPGQRVLICDDLLATGGTIKATIELVEQLGGIVVGCAFLIELMDLHGRDKIDGYDIVTFNGILIYLLERAKDLILRSFFDIFIKTERSLGNTPFYYLLRNLR